MESELETKKKAFNRGEAIIKDALDHAAKIRMQAVKDGETVRVLKEQLETQLVESREFYNKVKAEAEENEDKAHSLEVRDHELLTNEHAVDNLKNQLITANNNATNLANELGAILTVVTERLEALIDPSSVINLQEIINKLTITKNILVNKEGSLGQQQKKMDEQFLLLRDRRKLAKR